VTAAPVIAVDETHAVHLARHLADLYKRCRFTDMSVRCGGELFQMHASVVIYGSEYFRGMLAMAESGSRVFEVNEVRPRVLERVVEWLYCGELGEISDVDEGLALLEGSRFLRIKRLEAQCCAWLCAQIDSSKLVELVRQQTSSAEKLQKRISELEAQLEARNNPRVPAHLPSGQSQFVQTSTYVSTSTPHPPQTTEPPRVRLSSSAVELEGAMPHTGPSAEMPHTAPAAVLDETRQLRVRLSSSGVELASATPHTAHPAAVKQVGFPGSLPCCYCRYLSPGSTCLYCKPPASEAAREPVLDIAHQTPCGFCQSFCEGQCRGFCT
jgi:hypothetical protein